MEIVAYVSVVLALVALVVSVLAYRRTGVLKTLDLRIEVRKLHAELFHVLAAMPEKLEFAKRSREHVSAARGMFRSGEMQVWRAEWDADFALANELKDSIPPADETFLSMDQAVLEARLVGFTATQLAAAGLRQKYDACLLEDDKHRAEIQASKSRANAPT